MECFYCHNPAVGQCKKCGRFYCQTHASGTSLCYSCHVRRGALIAAVLYGLTTFVIATFIVVAILGVSGALDTDIAAALLELVCIPPLAGLLAATIIGYRVYTTRVQARPELENQISAEELLAILRPTRFFPLRLVSWPDWTLRIAAGLFGAIQGYRLSSDIMQQWGTQLWKIGALMASALGGGLLFLLDFIGNRISVV
jgi:hypothetical protein